MGWLNVAMKTRQRREKIQAVVQRRRHIEWSEDREKDRKRKKVKEKEWCKERQNQKGGNL